MAKPRLCFTLLYADGIFYLSRNFNLQAVGNLDWVMDNYDFESIARSIDELIILNVSQLDEDWEDFCSIVSRLSENCFMPIAAGGGIRGIEQVESLFISGADKIILNSALYDAPDLIRQLVAIYGSQSVICSIDFRRLDGSIKTFKAGGKIETEVALTSAISSAVNLGVGEFYLTSIDKDGTGEGFDMPVLELAYKACSLPIIAAGGADTDDRLAEGLHSGFVSAVSTSHLFNFMGDGLKDARNGLEAEGIQMSKWNFEELVI